MSRKKIALLSNVTVDLIQQKLNKKYEVYIPEGYDSWIEEVLNPTSELYRNNLDAIVVLIDGIVTEEWGDISIADENINLWEQGINVLTKSFSDIPIFVSTIDFRENRIHALSERQYRTVMQNDWYQFIQDIVEETDNVYVYDLADKIADIGRKQFYSDKMWYMSNMPYSREGMLAVCDTIIRLLDTAFEPRKKIIVVDLDNTLWGGVIGEEGIEGIELSNHKEGQRFYDFQRCLKEMQKRGVLLAIVSKNNFEDVEQVIKGHPYMLLRDDSFVAEKVNWNEKAENLKDLESELNLTEGSFVFIDDNPAEREKVKGAYPDILVPDFPTDTTTLKDFAEDIYFNNFLSLKVLEEDKNKTQMYQTEVKRKQDFDQTLSLDEYLMQLELVADIHRMRSNEIDRVVQLCGKTNQFNVTTKRYTKEEIADIASDEKNAIYVTYMSDKYGAYGLVSIIILLGSGDRELIDTFLMSCRVMGRKLENVIIDELVKNYNGECKYFDAEYIPTAKNVPVKDLYDRLGFHLINEQKGKKTYELHLDDFYNIEPICYKKILFKND